MSLFLSIFGLFPLFSASSVNWENVNASETPPNIVAIGDVMLSRSVGAQTKKYGTSAITDFYNPFSVAREWDFALLNLESPFSEKDRDTNEASFYFASNPKNIKIISWLADGKNGIVSLANNHIYNAGFDGFRTTISSLDDAGIAHIGLSKNERIPFISLRRANRLYCFGAYSYDGRAYFDKKTKENWFVNSLANAKKDIFAMNDEHCDEKIFMLHWGQEYKFSPNKSQRDLAYFLIDNGATLIIGGHSHILGETENYKGRMIFYSLGNAIFDQEWGKRGCQKWMDCITDPKTKKQIVPTNIGTSVTLSFPYSDFSFQKWDISVGKMEKREDL